MQIRNEPTPESHNQEDSPNKQRCGVSKLPPPDLFDPLIEMYKKDVDRTLLIKNLDLTPAERAEKLVDFVRFLDEMRRAGQRLPPRTG